MKYAYLEDDQKIPIIIANNLQSEQEERLLHVLRKHRKSIGINSFICMHRILLEEEAQPMRQPQRQLNPTILDVVKKEVMKLLVVPKKSEMTVVKNQNDELVPTRIRNNYRKLNQATRKDHFPLPYIDQVLERLGGYMQLQITSTGSRRRNCYKS
ncbi:hypothetical protein CR513_04702, partial [Mucuna pruriens]